jgi:hypothetical protein
VQQKVALARPIDRCGDGTDPCRAQPEVHPLGTGAGEQGDGLAPLHPEFGEHVGGGARSVTHLRKRHRGAGDRHHHPIAELFGALVEHRGHGVSAGRH